MILNTSKLAIEMAAATARKSALGAATAEPPIEAKREAGVPDELQLVSFELDGQEYALPIESVQEIVQVPETINTIPNSDGHVLGVMNLRNRLLPLVSLRSMFGLPPTAVGEQSRIVVVAHRIGGVEQRSRPRHRHGQGSACECRARSSILCRTCCPPARDCARSITFAGWTAASDWFRSCFPIGFF